jgi:hypothetical protein
MPEKMLAPFKAKYDLTDKLAGRIGLAVAIAMKSFVHFS